ncbi:hypothetical protein B0H10DRAFT_2228347 [Mycena sp. CBHHK59/15]|nr:hypothetical protein B0H10DRAFT_2228347 [Mycena sp. CBHHK59/15]
MCGRLPDMPKAAGELLVTLVDLPNNLNIEALTATLETAAPKGKIQICATPGQTRLPHLAGIFLHTATAGTREHETTPSVRPLEGHFQRVIAHQTHAAGVGASDGNGDEDGEWEFAHLLGSEEPRSASDWVEFNVRDKGNLAEEYHRSISTQDSDLDARYLVQPAADDPALVVHTFTPRRLLPQSSRSTTEKRPAEARTQDPRAWW